MKYLTPFNIWETPVELLAHVQPGQWVYAGDKGTSGRFLGVKKSGSVVVAWHLNAKAQKSPAEYHRILRAYAKA